MLAPGDNIFASRAEKRLNLIRPLHSHYAHKLKSKGFVREAMSKLPDFTSVRELRYGRDPYLDAWLLHFMTENNIRPTVNPAENAQQEQLRFMVDVDDDQVFVPCSDEMFENLLHTRLSGALLQEYREKWRLLVHLVHINIKDRYTGADFRTVEAQRSARCCMPLSHSFAFLKQLLTIFMAMSGVHDPQRTEKQLANRRTLDSWQARP